jgi:hypothetical protein
MRDHADKQMNGLSMSDWRNALALNNLDRTWSSPTKNYPAAILINAALDEDAEQGGAAESGQVLE